MERLPEELAEKNPADPKDSEEGHYVEKEERVSDSYYLRTSTIERQAAYIRAYNRYIFGFDVRT